MIRIPNAPVLCLPLVLVMPLVGCGETQQGSATSSQPTPPKAVVKPAVDPDDVPIKEADVKRPANYADAVDRIKGYRDTIRDEIAAGRPTKAHRALDELDIVLDWLPAIARDHGVPKDRWEEVNTTAQQVRELFNKVHSNIDDKKDPDYKSVSTGIDEAIGRLAGITAKAPADKK